MKRSRLLSAAAACVALAAAASAPFEERFNKELSPGWSWVREDRDAWSLADGLLRMRPLRGSVWGGDNTAKNILVRAAPEAESYAVEVTLSDVSADEARAPGLYEQAGLLWYVDDENYVKLVREWYDGKWMIVLAAERAARAEYAEAVAPEGAVRLRFALKGRNVVGQFRKAGEEGEWAAGGEFELPAKPAADDGRAVRVGLTAHTPGADPAEGRRAGFDDFVFRPEP